MTKHLFILLAFLFAGLFSAAELSAQANLSFQGILKKANGLAVDDGTYTLTFTLYTAATGGTIVHDETISDVEVAGGIYSVILGAQAGDLLTAPFDVPYFLGIKVGGPGATEMVPRIRLTSAPYALALRGSTNSFPGSGQVLADKINVNGAVLAKGGAPSATGNGTGHTFSTPGDDNGGLYSTEDNVVSIYANGSERIKVSNKAADNRTYLKSNVTVDNSLTINDQLSVGGVVGSDLDLVSQKSLKYNGIADWRLVDTDIFSSGNAQGWIATTGLHNSTDATTAPVVENFSNHFLGYALRPDNESDVLKKEFTLDRNVIGNFSHIKIRFKYFFLDSWDIEQGSNGPDIALAGVGTTKSMTTMGSGWSSVYRVYEEGVEELDFYDSSSNYSDAATVGEMIFTTRNNADSSFWVFFAAKMVGADDENYAIGDIEVWVK